MLLRRVLRTVRVLRVICVVASAGALGLVSTSVRAEDEPAAPTIYKWIDENGVAHYTTDRDRIPSQIRDRVERSAPRATDVAAPPHREDLMRDAHKKPAADPLAAPAPLTPAPVAATPPAPAPAPRATPPAPEPVAPEQSIPEPVAVEPPPEPDEEPTPIAVAPAPEDDATFEDVPRLADDAPEAIDPVSAPPPAPPAAVAPQQVAELAKLDEQIVAVESEIAQREETLAALISSSDEQRTVALVDDPAFREISQRLPKLQAELQTLRERRNEIVPASSVQ